MALFIGGEGRIAKRGLRIDSKPPRSDTMTGGLKG